MKLKQNIWPFGKGQPLGRKTTHHRRATKPVSEKALAKQAKERESERLERKLSDSQLEAKLRRHYSGGGNLREFLAANPGAVVKCHLCRKPLEIQHTLYRESDGRLVHDYCHRTRGAARSNASGRLPVAQEVRLAQKVMTGAWGPGKWSTVESLIKAGMVAESNKNLVVTAKGKAYVDQWHTQIAWPNPAGRCAARENPTQFSVRRGGKFPSFFNTLNEAFEYQREHGGDVWTLGTDTGHKWKRLRGNPSDDAAADVYEEFHGRPSSEVVTVTEKIHYHKNLAALGELRTLIVQARDGARVTLTRFKKAILCTNEAKNQLFVRGGDQSVDLGSFGIRTAHEIETLGKVLELAYFTTKDHLGDEGGTALYFHVAGETNENGKRKMAGWGPDLIYHTVDERLEFSGGSYMIRAEGVDK